MALYRAHVLICHGTGCASGGSPKVLETFREELKENLEKEVLVIATGCHGMCGVRAYSCCLSRRHFLFPGQTADVPEIVVGKHLYKEYVNRLLYKEPISARKYATYKEIPFYGKQHRICLQQLWLYQSDNIGEYISRDGYQALGKCITEMTPAAVVDEMKKSGLRGRGGGGFHRTQVEFLCASTRNKKVCHLQR
jgi:NADH-quinone oxidoreductase subunit F/NADP-reducing hydrogenase subunit HndC